MVEFRLTRNPALLRQYYALRERCFREELGLTDFDGSEEPADRKGQVLLAVHQGRCIAGARISQADSLRSQVQRLRLGPGPCCIWERFVFDPDVRSVPLIRSFVGELVTVSADSGYDHAMILSSLRNARFYRLCHSALGVGFEIHRQVPHCAQGKFSGLEHYLSVSHLNDRQEIGVAA